MSVSNHGYYTNVHMNSDSLVWFLLMVYVSSSVYSCLFVLLCVVLLSGMRLTPPKEKTCILRWKMGSFGKMIYISCLYGEYEAADNDKICL